jgi:FSR family fosmidomycin resistance protein-like MFS transporter
MSLNRKVEGSNLQATRGGRRVLFFTLTLLAIEFLDEFVDGARGAAWPLIYADLQLSYGQVGMLLSLPSLIANLIEPILGILGDMGQRRTLVLGGGVAFALALLLIALSHNFSLLLFAFILFYPASGAFVSLSQAALMDADSTRHEQNMARWAFSGSMGVVVGQLALSASVALGWGWRGLFLASVALALLLLGLAWRYPFATSASAAGSEDTEQVQDLRIRPPSPPNLGGTGFTPPKVGGLGGQNNGVCVSPEVEFKQGVSNALQALRRREVLRWLTLLEFSDLMLDILGGFLALYFVYVVGVTKAQAALAVTVWAGVGLLGDLLLIPLLERVRGLDYLRCSALLVLFLFPAFLLVPSVTAKLVILGLLGFFNAGWYSILKGRLYSAMPGQSSSVMTVGNVFGLIGGLIPLGLGLVADRYGLETTMWLLILGPVTLLIGIPRES